MIGDIGIVSRLKNPGELDSSRTYETELICLCLLNCFEMNLSH